MKLTINIAELVEAMDQFQRDINDWYLDKQTGKVLLVPEEVMEVLEDDGSDETAENKEEDAEQEAEYLADWQIKEREICLAILNDTQNRYERIPEFESLRIFGIMRRFAASVKNPSVREQLEQSFEGGASFRRFRSTLREHPSVRQDWFSFADQHKEKWAKEWLESIGIELL